MSFRRLILLRHGETEFNRARRMQGHLDVVLTARGREQASRVAPVLAAKHPLAIVSSDAQRATQTAQAISDLCGVPVQLDSRLRETDMGAWTGLDHAEVEAHWPGDRPKWRSDPTFAPPGGETRLAVAARAMNVVRDLHRTLTGWGQDDRPVLLVAHGGTFLALAAARSSTHRCRTTPHSPRWETPPGPNSRSGRNTSPKQISTSIPQQLALVSPRFHPSNPATSGGSISGTPLLTWEMTRSDDRPAGPSRHYCGTSGVSRL